MTNPTDTELTNVTETLAELRGMLEMTDEHLKLAAIQHNNLSIEVETLKRVNSELALDLRQLKKRVDELRPVTRNCPHCGRKVQADWTNCRICLKPL